MQYKEAITYINENAAMWLKADKSNRGYICPICGSGSGPKGTGITENPENKNHFTCWKGCFSSKSFVDILAVKNHIDQSDTGAVVENACRELGLNLDLGNDYASRKDINCTSLRNPDLKKIETVQLQPTVNKTVTLTETEEADYANLFDEWHKNIEQTDYWKKRGLSLDTMKHFNIGYCKNWKHPKASGKMFETERLIIPTGKGSYLARYTGEKDINCTKMKVGHNQIFNAQVLKSATVPIFVVEGEIDAMSIYEATGTAVALGSVSMIHKFLRLLEEVLPSQPVIFALDNDKAGQEAVEKAKAQEEQLRKKGVKLVFADSEVLFARYKDANEAMVADYFGFASRIEEEIQFALDVVNTNSLDKCNALNCIDAMQAFIRDSKNNVHIPTGFANLDEALDGGMYPGLYVVGAISSLGKTTLCLQIADQIAQQGRDVIIFSLEMSKFELMAKSISRLTCILDVEATRSSTNAKTMRGILDGNRYQKYSQKEKDLILKAWDKYKTFAGYLFIYESYDGISVKQIRNIVQEHTERTGRAPVVMVDYLQILDAPEGLQFLSDKQITDKNVKSLKILSRDFNTVVIGISSFNRDNYSAPVNMASFKESGAIEYSSDVLIGLQYAKMEEFSAEAKDSKAKAQLLFNEVTAKTKEHGGIVEVQVKILKNRNGSKGSETLDFCPMFNVFSIHRGPDVISGMKGGRKIAG